MILVQGDVAFYRLTKEGFVVCCYIFLQIVVPHYNTIFLLQSEDVLFSVLIASYQVEEACILIPL
jgi:hypothetical protein